MAEVSPCHPDATCTNTIGSFECICNSGLVGNGITTCLEPSSSQVDDPANNEVDTITEAPPDDGSCQVNTDCQGSNMECIASFKCACLPGYAQVGPNCQNEVHCDAGGFNNDCHQRATCQEQDGFPGFSCTCIDGWEDAFEGANGKSCKDICPLTTEPPEPITESSTSLPEGVGPHPNRPTVFPPQVVCNGVGVPCFLDTTLDNPCCTPLTCIM